MAKLNRDGYPVPDVGDNDYERPTYWEDLVRRTVNIVCDEAGYPVNMEDKY